MYIRSQLFLGINHCQTSLKVAVLEQVWDKGILAHLKTGSDTPTMALFRRTRFRYADRVSAVASSQSWRTGGWWLCWKEMELPFHNFDPIHLPKRPQYKWGKVDAISVWFSGSPASLDRRHYSSHCWVTLRRVGLTYVTGAGSKWEVTAATRGQRDGCMGLEGPRKGSGFRFPAPTLKGAHNSRDLSLFLASLGTARMCTAPLPHSHLPRIRIIRNNFF